MKQHLLHESSGKLILVATILASGMAFLDGTVVNIAVPNIQQTLHAALSGIQWVVNGYMLMLASLILIAGSLGDIFGRRKIFLIGIGVFTFASFLCSISHSIQQLALFRVLQGIGGAMMVPGSLSIINASFAEEVRGKVIGMWSGYSGGLIALGPFLGGWLVQTFSWPAIFYINIPIGILAFFLTLWFVPESKSEEKRSIDISGALLIFLSLLALSYGLIIGPDKGWGTDFSGVSVAVGVALFICFILAEMRAKYPLVPFSIFASSLVTGANLVTFFLYFALNGTMFFFVLNLQQAQHIPPLFAGLALLPTILLITFLSGPAGSLADNIGPRIPMVVGPLLVSLGMFLLSLSGSHANYITGFFPGLMFFGLGMALVIAPLTKSALSVDSKFSGAASGINNAVARIAGLFAIALLGGMMLFVFSSQLHKGIQSLTVTSSAKNYILLQTDRLGAIELPKTLTQSERNVSQQKIDTAFISGFRVVMGVNAFLALLSAGTSFVTIKSGVGKKKDT